VWPTESKRDRIRTVSKRCPHLDLDFLSGEEQIPQVVENAKGSMEIRDDLGGTPLALQAGGPRFEPATAHQPFQQVRAAARTNGAVRRAMMAKEPHYVRGAGSGLAGSFLPAARADNSVRICRSASGSRGLVR